MTIDLTDNAPRVSYTVSTSTTSFAVPFEFFDDADLVVVVGGTTKTLTTHYTVSGGDGATGTVTMTSGNAVSSGTVIIFRDIDFKRTTDFPTSGAFPIATLNTELDRNIALFDDLQDRIDRSVRLTDSDDAATMTIPVKASRLGKILGFHATTGAVEAVGDSSTITIIQNAIGDNTLTLTGTITGGTLTTAGTVNFGSLADGTITITAFVDEDDMSSNSATLVPTQQSVKAYVDSQVTAQDLDATTDSGTIAIDLDSETLTIAGGEGIDTSATGNTITIAGEDASSTNKGIASFPANQFTCSSGNVTINASQTTITSLLATDIKIGEDDNTKIDFETADEIHFYANGSEQVFVSDGVFGPQTDSDVDLGTNTVRWKDAFIDTITTTSHVTVGGNVSVGGSINKTGDLTVDVSGDINIDAGGANINFLDDGTMFGFFLQSSGGMNIGAGTNFNNGTGIILAPDSGTGVVTTQINGPFLLNNNTVTMNNAQHTFDCAGDLVIDTDQGNSNQNLILKDGGTTYASFTQSSGELVIKSGSSLTTAITFVGANATLSGDLTFVGANYNVVWDKSDNTLEFGDNAVLRIGTGNDLDIYHSSNVNFIKTQTDLPINVVEADGNSMVTLTPNGETVFNDSSQDRDFRVEGANFANVFFVDASIDDIGIRTSTPSSNASVSVFGEGGANYNGISIRNTDSDNTNKGGVAILGSQKASANDLWTGVGFWDDGTNRLLTYGGGGWGNQEATKHAFYAGTYDQGSGNADEIFTIASGLSDATNAVVVNESSQDTDFRVESDGNSHGLFVEASSGEVGINTSDPANFLHVQGSSEAAVTIGSASSRSGIFIFGPGSTTTRGSLLCLASDNTFRLGTSSYYHQEMRADGTTILNGAGNEALKIDTNRIISTNVAVDDYALKIKNTNANPFGPNIEFTNSPDNNTALFLQCVDGTTARLKIFSDGDVQNHDNSYGSLSDQRIKQDIVDANSQWDDIKAIRVRNFKKKDDVDQYGDKATSQIGVIAQELETVSPKLIKETPPSASDIKHSSEFGTLYEDGDDIPDGKEIGDIKEIKENVKNVSYSVLYMKAVKALQEAMTRIETLEAKVAKLEGE